MESTQQKIADLLEQSIGLTITSVGASTFQRALNNRKRTLGIEEDEAYLEKLTVSFMELRRLVEEVVVPETWFFRDQEPFHFLTKYVHSSEKDFTKEIFRILSIPCSTGEEPYSIAMTLLQAGLKPSSFYIDAVDVSNRSLSVARQGVYKQNSFRTEDLDFRDQFFMKVADGYSIKKLVREKVRFVHGNILQPSFLDSLGVYNVVFCRNLLIYFNKESQDQAVKALFDLLVPQGILFTGHSEASLFMGKMFTPVAHARAFAFYRQELPKETVWIPPKKIREVAERASTEVSKLPRSLIKRQIVKKARVQKQINTGDDFARVQQLADEGNLDEAARICQLQIRKHNSAAKWYYMLGLISDSKGKTEEAKQYFRKAVYLEPGNVESLIQLGLLAERSGDIEKAANYRRRAQRIQEKG